MIPLELWLRAPKLRADAEVPSATQIASQTDPGDENDYPQTIRRLVCAMCGGEGVLYHALEGAYGREPCMCQRFA